LHKVSHLKYSQVVTINAYLKSQGLAGASLDERAKALNISPVTLWRILNRKTGISLGTVKKIEDKTGGKVRYRDLANAASAEVA